MHSDELNISLKKKVENKIVIKYVFIKTTKVV